MSTPRGELLLRSHQGCDQDVIRCLVVTTQVVPAIGSLLVLVTPIVVVVGGVSAVAQVARGRIRGASVAAGCVGFVCLLYGVALLGTGLASAPQQLKIGDSKCFDDWCAAMLRAHGDPITHQLLVNVRLENRGQARAMKSDLARAYIEVPGQPNVLPLDGSGLQAILEAGGHAAVLLVFDMPAAAPGARFVVAEGADTIGPGIVTIGDEASPFHARAGWPLATSLPPSAR